MDPARVAAIIIEPVQGEGGFYAAPAELLRKLRALCDQHGILLIADEVQSGFGRTGRMFAIEHSGVEPDLMTVAKSIAGGVPLSAVIGKAEIMDAPAPADVTGTLLDTHRHAMQDHQPRARVSGALRLLMMIVKRNRSYRRDGGVDSARRNSGAVHDEVHTPIARPRRLSDFPSRMVPTRTVHADDGKTRRG